MRNRSTRTLQGSRRRRSRAPHGVAHLVRRAGGPAGSRRRMLLSSLGVIAAVVGLGAWARVSLLDSKALHEWLRSPTFQLQTVLILGLDALQPADVLAKSGLRAGTPLIDLRLEALRARIEANARIRRLRGARLFPNRLLLAVEERRPVARLAGSRDALDREGARFPLTPDEGADLPEISGDPAAALALLATADRLGIEIESVQVKAPGDLLLRQPHSSARLRVGRDAARAFADWRRLRSSGALRDFSGFEVDLRFRGNAILTRGSPGAGRGVR